MNISQPYKNQKNRAQAMMEFALVIPVLLLLLYGVLETGRLLFIYSSTITAARQAVRYGSATGELDNGTAYYNDCDGIRAAAKKVGFINRFEDADINITYDGGVNSGNGSSIALNPNPACGSFATPKNGDRIIVEVTEQWVPIVSIVPLKPFTITSTSERTILASVDIAVDGEPGVFVGPNDGVLTLGVSASTASVPAYSRAGQIITFTYTLTNTGGGASVLTGPFSITTTINGIAVSTTCNGAPASLAAGASFTCAGTYSYTITQEDMDAGSFTSSSVGNAGASVSSAVLETFTMLQLPALSLSISPNPAVASTEGTVITYTYTITNTGNVTLTSPYTVTDNIASNLNCSGAVSPLKPGDAPTTCTATYHIKSIDITNGFVANQATAFATYNSSLIPSNLATAIVSTSPLKLELSASPTTATLPYPDQVITYKYKITNNSASTMNSLGFTFSKGAVPSCPSTTIAVGAFIECTSTYTVTVADYDAGGTLINSAKATANNGSVISSNPADVSVAISQNPVLSVVVSGSPSKPTSPATELPVGTLIEFTYTLENKGNVTISSYSVTDNKSVGPITCLALSLAPKATTTCKGGKYPVTAPDIAAGSIVNKGTASYVFGATPSVSIPTSATVITYSGARIRLDISASRTKTIPENDTTTVAFTYTLTNTGGKPLTTLSIASSIPTPNCSAATSPLDPGMSTTCSSPVYEASETFKNVSTATAKNGETQVSSGSSLTVNVCSKKTIIVNGKDTNTTSAWTIQNTVGVPLALTSFGFNWDVLSDKNRSLDQVNFPVNIPIYTSGPGKGKGTTSGLAKFEGPTYGPWTINTGATASFNMEFFKSGMAVKNMVLTFSESACGFIYTTVPYNAQ